MIVFAQNLTKNPQLESSNVFCGCLLSFWCLSILLKILSLKDTELSKRLQLFTNIHLILLYVCV